MVRGRLDAKASTATGYAWLVWEKDAAPVSKLMWVPPCRRNLERASDYNSPARETPLISPVDLKSCSLFRTAEESKRG
jgi:hypothetical protein